VDDADGDLDSGGTGERGRDRNDEPYPVDRGDQPAAPRFR
jgi:hypothetical protein